jgi:hypothetical protein
MAVSDSLAAVALSPVVVLVGSLDAPVLVGAPVLVDASALVAPPLEVLASAVELVSAVVADIVPPLSPPPPPPPHPAIISAAHEQTKLYLRSNVIRTSSSTRARSSRPEPRRMGRRGHLGAHCGTIPERPLPVKSEYV